MADDQPKQGFGAKVGDFLNKFDKKVRRRGESVLIRSGRTERCTSSDPRRQ